VVNRGAYKLNPFLAFFCSPSAKPNLNCNYTTQIDLAHQTQISLATNQSKKRNYKGNFAWFSAIESEASCASEDWAAVFNHPSYSLPGSVQARPSKLHPLSVRPGSLGTIGLKIRTPLESLSTMVFCDGQRVVFKGGPEMGRPWYRDDTSLCAWLLIKSGEYAHPSAKDSTATSLIRRIASYILCTIYKCEQCYYMHGVSRQGTLYKFPTKTCPIRGPHENLQKVTTTILVRDGLFFTEFTTKLWHICWYLYKKITFFFFTIVEGRTFSYHKWESNKNHSCD